MVMKINLSTIENIEDMRSVPPAIIAAKWLKFAKVSLLLVPHARVSAGK